MILRRIRSGGDSSLKILRENDGKKVEIAPRANLGGERRREGEKEEETVKTRPPRGIYTLGKLCPDYPGPSPDCPGESPDNPAPPEDLQMCLRMNDLELKSNEDLVA